MTADTPVSIDELEAGAADLTVNVPGYETFGPERVDVAEHEERHVVARLRRTK